MSIFKKKISGSVPKECEGMEVRIMTGSCTGEKTIGFYDRSRHELMYAEFVRSKEDIAAFYERYGLPQPKAGK